MNRIDSNRRSFMNRLEVDSIWRKYTALSSIGKPRIVLEIYEVGNRSISHKHPAEKYRGGQIRATACIAVCSPPTALGFFFGGAD